MNKYKYIALFVFLAVAMAGVQKNSIVSIPHHPVICQFPISRSRHSYSLEQEIHVHGPNDGYQIGQNLNADDYCGYAMPDQNFRQGPGQCQLCLSIDAG